MRAPVLPLAGLLLLLAGCSGSVPEGGETGEAHDVGRFTDLPARPRAGASERFWSHWGDGRAELSGYRAVVTRYGEPREAELVLIYVTEPMDRRTWIKDDAVPEPHRVHVLKLNESRKFLTGIYPYSVMTSVFAPVERWREERFAPVKITMSAQEWCGHVFHAVWPGGARFRSTLFSYFAEEGERTETVEADRSTLYEDALLIQLRELDGPFNGGRDWQGPLVPALWARRAAHEPLRPVPATLTRSRARRDGAEVNRFVLAYGGLTRTIDVETAPPHRVLGWATSTGERAELVRTARLPYWQLNDPEGAAARAALGLGAGGYALPAPDGTAR